MRPFSDRRSLSCPSLDVDPSNLDQLESNHEPSISTFASTTKTTASSRTRILISQSSFSNGDVPSSGAGFEPGPTKKFLSSGLLAVPARKRCDYRSFHRIPAPYTRSNLEIDDDIMEEEEEMYMNERNLEHRRLSTSLPFGLNLIERLPLETTV